MITVIDNFLPEWLHMRAKEQLLNPNFDWHFPGYGGMNQNPAKACFANIPYVENAKSDFSNCDALVYAFDCWLYENRNNFKLEYLSRCLINFYTAGQNTGWHQDMIDDEDAYSLIYYVNDSDGGTEFKNGEKVEHKENRFVFFKSTDWHAPITSTTPRRINVNWIMKGNLIK
jgi:hypothetical protein